LPILLGGTRLQDLTEGHLKRVSWPHVDEADLQAGLVEVEALAKGYTPGLIEDIYDQVMLVEVTRVVEGEFFILDHLEEKELPALGGSRSVNQFHWDLALISEVKIEGGNLAHSRQADQDLIAQCLIISVKRNGCEGDDDLLH